MYFLRIPDPDALSDEQWAENYRRYEFLFQNNYLPIEAKK
jgi:hypothetical protein